MSRIPVTGGTDRYPIVDRRGTRLHVGDRLRAQCCVGRYGAVRIVEHTITEEQAHWPLCFLDVTPDPNNRRNGSCLITTRYDHQDQQLHCQDTFHDYEHEHETWAEVLS